MTPSRSAHGDSSTRYVQRPHRLPATTAPANLVRAAGDTPSSSARRGGLDPGDEADQLVAARRRCSSRGTRRPAPSTARRRRAGRACGRSCCVADHPVRRAGASSFRAAAARAARRRACELLERGQVGGARRRPGRSRVMPAGAERQRQRDVGVLVDAGRQLQRAAADVEDEQPAGAPAEPPADGEEGQPRLVLAGEHLQVHAGLLPDPARAPRRPLRASRMAEVAKASSSSQRCSLGLPARASAPPRAAPSPPPSTAGRRAATCSASRSTDRSSCMGVGCAPRWASTTSRWTVLEPTSSTPSRMARASLHGGTRAAWHRAERLAAVV